MKYFEDKNFTLYLGDSSEILNIFDDKSIDMVFVDPPYFLFNEGITCQNGKMVSIYKAKWDETMFTFEEKLDY